MGAGVMVIKRYVCLQPTKLVFASIFQIDPVNKLTALYTHFFIGNSVS